MVDSGDVGSTGAADVGGPADAEAGSTVRENVAAARFEIRRGDRLAGFVDYADRDGVVALTHTEVLPEFGGRGVGSELVLGALEALRDRGARVLPLCPFVPKVILDHPDFVALVPEDQRRRFGLPQTNA